MELDRAAADEALARLGARLELIGKAAWGVYQVVCENMASAARVHVIERGCDPRRFPLIAYGGGGAPPAGGAGPVVGGPRGVVAAPVAGGGAPAVVVAPV